MAPPYLLQNNNLKLKKTMTSNNINIDIKHDDELGLFKAEATLSMPTITVVKYAKDRDDFRYKLQSAFNEIVDELVETALQGL